MNPWQPTQPRPNAYGTYEMYQQEDSIMRSLHSLNSGYTNVIHFSGCINKNPELEPRVSPQVNGFSTDAEDEKALKDAQATALFQPVPLSHLKKPDDILFVPFPGYSNPIRSLLSPIKNPPSLLSINPYAASRAQFPFSAYPSDSFFSSSNEWWVNRLTRSDGSGPGNIASNQYLTRNMKTNPSTHNPNLLSLNPGQKLFTSSNNPNLLPLNSRQQSSTISGNSNSAPLNFGKKLSSSAGNPNLEPINSRKRRLVTNPNLTPLNPAKRLPPSDPRKIAKDQHSDDAASKNAQTTSEPLSPRYAVISPDDHFDSVNFSPHAVVAPPIVNTSVDTEEETDNETFNDNGNSPVGSICGDAGCPEESYAALSEDVPFYLADSD